jgi:hypothetical protein
VARALNRPLELTLDHDGRIVAEVVAEWARRHGTPLVLDLTGRPAEPQGRCRERH